jgi:hypothetical protein
MENKYQRIYRNTCSGILKDGTKKVYITRRIAYLKKEPTIITDEQKKSILIDYEYGLAKTKIANKHNTTAYYVSKVIKKHKDANKLDG